MSTALTFHCASEQSKSSLVAGYVKCIHTLFSLSLLFLLTVAWGGNKRLFLCVNKHKNVNRLITGNKNNFITLND